MIDFKPITNINNIPDHNGKGSVNYEFLMSEFPITNEIYCEFLNSMSKQYNINKFYKIETLTDKNQGIKYAFKNNTTTYSVKSLFSNKPSVYISYYDAVNFICWLNNNFEIIDHNFYNKESEYWLPSYDEWYKAAYFDGNKYYNFPYCSNITEISLDIHKYSFSCNNLLNSVCNIGLFKMNRSCYNIADMAGNIYELIRSDTEDMCSICGGSWNRNYMNAHKNTRRLINKKVYTDYIGIRVCKRIPARIFKIALYNNFGDGWKDSRINIIDNHGSSIAKNITLEEGYGPKIIEFPIYSQHMIIIQHISNNNLFFENHYEIFDDKMKKIYTSKSINSTNNYQIMVLNNV